MEAQQSTIDSRPDLKSFDREELIAFAVARGLPAYRGRQLFSWLYGRGASTFAEMTDLPLGLREDLERTARIGHLEPFRTQESKDGSIKILFKLSTGRHIETVLIPDFEEEGDVKRLTVCVSSQVGCAMGCTFCATGRLGFQQNLSAGEIFDQYRYMDRLAQERYGRGVTNIVFMGMGEPLLNYDNVVRALRILTHPEGGGLSPRRITVSTVGLARRIKQLADLDLAINLAVSLHAPTDAQRSAIMPVNRAAATDLTALREALQYYGNKTGRMVTYEYCLFHGFNDSPQDALNLTEACRWTPAKVNLILYNPVPGLPYERTPEEALHRFIRVLVREGVTVTVRRSKGQDIDAACGQLAAREAG